MYSFADFIIGAFSLRLEARVPEYRGGSSPRGACCSEEGEQGVDPPSILDVEAHGNGGGHDGR